MVILSADATPGVIRRLLALGALAYLTKPLDLAELGELLDSFAAPARTTRRYRDAEGHQHERRRPPHAREAGPVNRTVLYIEDNADNRRLVERLVKLHPQSQLHVATNARDGVKAAIDDRPALILLDNRLPDATGREVLRQLASSAARPGSPW